MRHLPTFSFDGMNFEIEIEVGDAFRIKADHDINLLKIFEGDNLDKLAMQMSVDDEKIINIWWDYVGTQLTDREAAVNKLKRDDLTKFKEAFWAAIVNFSDPAVKPVLLELKKRLPELLKQQVLSNLRSIENSLQNESSTVSS